ncbi:GtrA family protein [Coprobacter sp.]
MNFDHKTISQIIKFIIVGCINTGLSLAMFYILYNLFNINEYISNLIAYIVGLINSFFWNKLWVFRKNGGNIIREAMYFFIIFAVCYGIQFICFRTLVEYYQINANWAQIPAMIVYTITNYILNRFITFK